VIDLVIKSQKPMSILKTAGDESGGEVSGAEEDLIKYQNILAVPILMKGKVKGVIGVCDLMDPKILATEDFHLIENISGPIATTIENFELNRDIEETYYQTLVTLARVVEAKDAYSAGHLERVRQYVDGMADRLKLDAETKKILSGGAILHDLGKVGIPDGILKKEGRYDEEDYDVMRQHSVIGENILKPLQAMSQLSLLVRHHHESFDGSGYPDGLKGEAIPLTSRILTIADIYDALTTDRPYRKALSKPEAVTILKKYEGSKLDPQLTEIFIQGLQP
jgi:HD-GYP domain-containing protein (c-di-GMP phosphodiesterase class II)